MAPLSTALSSARSFLNDVQGITWSDPVLVPKAQEAFRELILELNLYENQLINFQSSPITVNAAPSPYTGPFVMPGTPANMVQPITLLEANLPDTFDDYEEMDKLTFMPTQTPDADLEVWAWMQNQIFIVGATQQKKVIIRYQGVLATPVRLTDDMGLTFAELYVGPRIAEIATKKNFGAANNLDRVIRYNINEDQRPVRRRGYRSMFRLKRFY